MRVEVDRDLCQGHAMCVLESPEVFAFDSKHDDTVRVIVDELGTLDAGRLDAVRRAVKFCPNQALAIKE